MTSEEWHAEGADQSTLLAEVNGKAQGYAMLLTLQSDRLNWVRTDWVWFRTSAGPYHGEVAGPCGVLRWSVGDDHVQPVVRVIGPLVVDVTVIGLLDTHHRRGRVNRRRDGL